MTCQIPNSQIDRFLKISDNEDRKLAIVFSTFVILFYKNMRLKNASGGDSLYSDDRDDRRIF